MFFGYVLRIELQFPIPLSHFKFPQQINPQFQNFPVLGHKWYQKTDLGREIIDRSSIHIVKSYLIRIITDVLGHVSRIGIIRVYHNHTGRKKTDIAVQNYTESLRKILERSWKNPGKILEVINSTDKFQTHINLIRIAHKSAMSSTSSGKTSTSSISRPHREAGRAASLGSEHPGLCARVSRLKVLPDVRVMLVISVMRVKLPSARM